MVVKMAETLVDMKVDRKVSMMAGHLATTRA